MLWIKVHYVRCMIHLQRLHLELLPVAFALGFDTAMAAILIHLRRFAALTFVLPRGLQLRTS